MDNRQMRPAHHSERPTPLGPFTGWYRTAAQADYEAEVEARSGVPRDKRLNLWNRVRVLGAVGIALLIVLAVLPNWLLLVLLIAGGVYLHRNGTGRLRRLLGPVGRFLLFDNRPVNERTGVEAFLTRDTTDPLVDADPATWLQRQEQLGRLVSPAKLRSRFPDIDSAVLDQYGEEYEVRRRERRKGRAMLAAAYTGTGALWVLGKAIDADGTRRERRIAGREIAREKEIERHRYEETKYYERANRRARRNGW